MQSSLGAKIPFTKKKISHPIFQHCFSRAMEKVSQLFPNWNKSCRNSKTRQKIIGKSIKEMATVMGGENGDEYGPGGPLYALRDSGLNNIEAGKYTYGILFVWSWQGPVLEWALEDGPEPDLTTTAAIRCGPGKWSLLLEWSSTICHGTHHMWPQENQIVSVEEHDMYWK